LWKRLWRYGRYALVLIGEILKANFAVMRVILTPPHQYDAAIVRIKVPLQRNSSRVILANSITLTPGTVTVAQEGEDFLVLCLHKKDAYEIPGSRLVKLLREVEETGWN
ncbi:MAG: Na+/H+ antiporter subunit E, partial [Oscillospiraceae bacterium]|nr:Na+/H+ antiporter subunit E [Oscillospiraceae bacterium]